MCIEQEQPIQVYEGQCWVTEDVQCEHEDRVKRLQREYNTRLITLEYEVSHLREQLSLWRNLAVTVVEGTDKAVQKWMGHLNDAVLLGIEEVEMDDG